MKTTSRLLRLILFISLLPSMTNTLRAEQASPIISYNKSTDMLSVNANDASFKDVMARIASLSGIEILMDPKAEHNITIILSDTPLEKALKELSRKTSHVFIYDDPKPDNNKDNSTQAKPILISMQILPKGEFSNDMLLPLLAPGGEAFIREKDRYASPAQNVEIFNHAQQRWEARLKMMPPERREELLANAQEKREKLEQKQIEKKKQKEEHAQKRKEHEQRRLAKLEELKATDPETYERKMKAREQIRQGLYQAQ